MKSRPMKPEMFSQVYNAALNAFRRHDPGFKTLYREAYGDAFRPILEKARVEKAPIDFKTVKQDVAKQAVRDANARYPQLLQQYDTDRILVPVQPKKPVNAPILDGAKMTPAEADYFGMSPKGDSALGQGSFTTLDEWLSGFKPNGNQKLGKWGRTR